MSEQLQQLATALQSGTLQDIRPLINRLSPAEIADFLESLPPPQRNIAWQLLDNEGDILAEINDEVRSKLLEQMDTDEVVSVVESLETDDVVDILQDLPDDVADEVLQSMDQQDRQRIESVLSYPEDSAGGLMSTEVLTVRADVTLDVVLRYLRMHGDQLNLKDHLIVIDRENNYLGSLSLNALLTSNPWVTVSSVMSEKAQVITVDMSTKEVANLFEDLDLISAPVVDHENKLLGYITIDDVVDVIREEGEHSLMAMAGLNEEEDMFAPVIVSSKRRSLWLGINLLTAFLAAGVISLFEKTLEEVVTLAILMPIVASMGGIAGSQTLTLIIRGIALEQVNKNNSRWLLIKELSVGLLNGLLWAIIIAIATVVWFEQYELGILIAVAIVINMISAAFSGVTIPLILKHFGIDPALAGSVILTTVTDVVGFMAFLGFATLYLL